MNRIKFLIPLILGVTFFTSCRKEYRCACTDSFCGVVKPVNAFTKFQAKKACEGQSTDFTKCKLMGTSN